VLRLKKEAIAKLSLFVQAAVVAKAVIDKVISANGQMSEPGVSECVMFERGRWLYICDRPAVRTNKMLMVVSDPVETADPTFKLHFFYLAFFDEKFQVAIHRPQRKRGHRPLGNVVHLICPGVAFEHMDYFKNEFALL
jgi:hypothetical protein